MRDNTTKWSGEREGGGVVQENERFTIFHEIRHPNYERQATEREENHGGFEECEGIDYAKLR